MCMYYWNLIGKTNCNAGFGCGWLSRQDVWVAIGLHGYIKLMGMNEGWVVIGLHGYITDGYE